MVALLIAAGVAVLAQRYPQSWDLTRDHRHVLSATSKKVLKQMAGPVSVTAYASRQDIELGDVRKIIHDFVADYRLVKPDLTLTFVDPADAPQQARDAGIQANGELVLRYKNRSEHLTNLNEQAFTNTLLRLTRNRPPALFLDGHGERRANGGAPHDLGQFARQLANRGIKAQPLNLGSAPEIPRKSSLLVITGGQTDLLPGEAEKIRAYVERGGNLLWLVEPGPLHGYQPLVEALGLALPAGTLLDPQARGKYAVPAALVNSYGRHAATAEFDLDTVFPLARPLGFNESGGWHYAPLAETSAEAWVERDTPDANAEFDPQRDIAGPATLAAALERQVEDQTQRVAVIGSAAFASNAFLGLGGNLDLALNLVNWLAGDDDLIAIQPRAARDARLNLSKNAALAMLLIFLAGLPLAFLSAGSWVWWRRRG
ncbi:MAG: GldG family protein [Sulfuricella sp.]|nr:GldG family protein [Sulfuricella sp.]